MPTEGDIAWTALTILLGFVGFGSLVWAIANGVSNNKTAHNRIIELLEEMRNVEKHLDDVLKHPDDTSFSFKPILDELRSIKRKLEMIERDLTKKMGGTQ